MAYTFEDKVNVINNEIKKRRGKWRLKAVVDIDFSDVEQIIRLHIYEKWDKWDQEQPLEPWLNKVISNRMRNLLRDKYYKYTRPCLGFGISSKPCVYNEGGDSCGFTESGKQCSECPLFLKWEKKKKWSHAAHLPTSLEHHEHTIEAAIDSNYIFDSTKVIDRFHDRMKNCLPKSQYDIYKMLYIDNLDEDVVAKKLGYKKDLDKKRKSVRFKQLEKYQKKFLEIASKLVYEEGLE